MVWWTLALAAAQGLSSASAQKKNADATNRAQRRFEKLNKLFAKEDELQGYVAIAARRSQERSVLAQSLDQVSLDAARRIGAVTTSAGESGVKGNTQAALVNDFVISQLKSEQAIMDTEKYAQEQYQRDVDAVRTQAASRILMGQQQRVPGPNYAQIFIDAATSYMQMQSQYNAANTYQGKTVTSQSVPGAYPHYASSTPPSYNTKLPGPSAPMY